MRVSQEDFILKTLDKYNMRDAKTAPTPLPLKIDEYCAEALKPYEDIREYQSIVGSLIYISTSTRPDISYAVSYLSKKLHKPSKQHYQLAKRVLRYLKGTIKLCLIFKVEEKVNLEVYCDASYAEDRETRKSHTGVCVKYCGAAITWKSKRQPVIALSSTEAEYIALTSGIKEAKWLSILERELNIPKKPITIYEDNQSTMKLAENRITSERSKHIEVKYHYIRNEIEKKNFRLEYIPTEFQTADVLTKSLGAIAHQRHRKALGLAIVL